MYATDIITVNQIAYTERWTEAIHDVQNSLHAYSKKMDYCEKKALEDLLFAHQPTHFFIDLNYIGDESEENFVFTLAYIDTKTFKTCIVMMRDNDKDNPEILGSNCEKDWRAAVD